MNHKKFTARLPDSLRFLANRVKAQTNMPMAGIFRQGLLMFDPDNDTLPFNSNKPSRNKIDGVATTVHVSEEEDAKVMDIAQSHGLNFNEACTALLIFGLEKLKDQVEDIKFSSTYKTAFKVTEAQHLTIKQYCEDTGRAISRFAQAAVLEYERGELEIGWDKHHIYKAASSGPSINCALPPKIADRVREYGLEHDFNMQVTVKIMTLAFVYHLEEKALDF